MLPPVAADIQWGAISLSRMKYCHFELELETIVYLSCSSEQWFPTFDLKCNLSIFIKTFHDHLICNLRNIDKSTGSVWAPRSSAPFSTQSLLPDRRGRWQTEERESNQRCLCCQCVHLANVINTKHTTTEYHIYWTVLIRYLYSLM